MRDITTTWLFIEAARLAREDSRRYWAQNGDKHPVQRPIFWRPERFIAVEIVKRARALDGFRERNFGRASSEGGK